MGDNEQQRYVSHVFERRPDDIFEGDPWPVAKEYLMEAGYTPTFEGEIVSFYRGEKLFRKLGEAPVAHSPDIIVRKAKNGLMFTVPEGEPALERVVMELVQGL